MSLYGVCIRSEDDADVEWFTTDAELQPGCYVLKHRLKQRHSPSTVFLSETIPGLIMDAGDLLQNVEHRGRETLASPRISEADRKRLEEEYTQGLLTQLTETSSIWQENPRWVRKLEPA